jgi:carbon starvation protein
MNALVLVIASACTLALAYRFYAAFMAAKVLAINPDRPTPAQRLKDGRDYYPTNKWVLFGHHFAAIAGPGPLIGPVLAAQFGFLPGFLWILIGCVLGGVAHDLITLFASVRHEGRALSTIARDYVSPLTGRCTAIAVIFIIITALAGLAIVVVNALADSAWATFAIVSSIPAALIVGLWYNVLRKGKVTEATVVGVGLLIAGVLYGAHVQNASWGHLFLYDKHALALMLPVYGFIASVLPVWLLLCPRDYISSFMKIGVVGMLGVGIVVLHPNLHMPATTAFIKGGGPVVPGPVWPYVCITIACGAVSGFHALIASGTTPKMIPDERSILPIGGGAMLLEGFVAVLALIAATVLIPHDYFAINARPETFAKMLTNPNLQPLLQSSHSQLATLTRMVGEKTLAGRTGGAVSLAVGMAYIFSSIGGLTRLMGYWYHFAIMFEALFILTTIDTGTRVARYAFQEILSGINPNFNKPTWQPGVWASSALVCFAWGWLVYRGSIDTIWPMFGVANQLLAALALAIGTTFLLRRGIKRRYALIPFLPMCFMLVTTLTAGYMNVTQSYLTPKFLGTPKAFDGILMSILTLSMMALVAVIAADCGRIWLRLLRDDTKPLILDVKLDESPRETVTA